MSQLALIITRVACVVTFIIASNLSLLAMQQRDEIVDKLKRATQEMLDAVARGDKAVWERYLAEGSIYADEEGRVLTRHRDNSSLPVSLKNFFATPGPFAIKNVNAQRKQLFFDSPCPLAE